MTKLSISNWRLRIQLILHAVERHEEWDSIPKNAASISRRATKQLRKHIIDIGIRPSCKNYKRVSDRNEVDLTLTSSLSKADSYVAAERNSLATPPMEPRWTLNHEENIA